MARPSIVRRLTLFFAGALCAGFLALGWYLSAEIEHHFREIDAAILDNAIRRVAHVVDSEFPDGDLSGLHARLDHLMVGHDRVSLWVASADGHPLAADSAITFPQAMTSRAIAKASVQKSVTFDWEEGGHSYRGAAARVSVSATSVAPLQVAAALNIDHHALFLVAFRNAMWIAIGSSIAFSLLVSVVIARGGLRPLRTLVQQIDDISSNRLSRRLDSGNLPEELVGLADAFNAMMARLDASFARLSEFSADIAHELRTPVSNLLTQTQVMLSRVRSVEEYRDVLASNAEELERLSRMVSDMLFLAKTDQAAQVLARETIDLAAEVRDLFEFYEALAAESGVRLELEGELKVRAERLMLRRAINNLLSNALRYTTPGEAVTVSLVRDQARARISVSNPGAPIPDGVRQRLFERFYRADAARSRDSEGAGLGLAIVRAIAEAHGGGVTVASEDGRNTFTIWLPDEAAQTP